MIDLREQFQIDTNQKSISYQREECAIVRIQNIYRSSRKNKKDIGKLLWEGHFKKVWDERNNIPSCQNSFELWLKSEIYKLSSLLSDGLELKKIGMAQKFMSLFLKDLWAFNEVSKEVSDNFKPPLDKIILNHFTDVPTSWQSWTKVACKDSDFDDFYNEYLKITETFSKRYNSMSSQISSPLDLEQLLWHREKVE